jgi:hypothetical protein
MKRNAIMEKLPYTVQNVPGSLQYFVEETATNKISRLYDLPDAAALANWLTERYLGYPPR